MKINVQMDLIHKMSILFCTILFLTITSVHPSVEGGVIKQKPISEEPIKSIAATSDTAFGIAVFKEANKFYLGANTTGQKALAVSRAQVISDTTATPPSTTVQIQEIAPEKAYVNISSGTKAETEKTANPIYNADIKYMTTKGYYPVVVLGTKNPSDTIAPSGGTNQVICRIADFAAGETVVTNIDKLNDANEAETSGIVGIAASSANIFAAVAPNGGTFGQANSGIAVLRDNSAKLFPIDAPTGEEGNKALPISAGTNVTINNHATMFYDSAINRLFIGLHVSRSSGTATGYGILVGRVTEGNEPKLVLDPIMPDTVMTLNNNNYILGFKNNTDAVEVKIHAIRTLRTSTGKRYLIVNGNVYTGGVTQNEVFAIPMVNKVFTDQNVADVDDIGKVTDNDSTDQSAIISAEAKTTKQADAYQGHLVAKVGDGDTPGDVLGMETLGEAVYIYCAHATNKEQQGIFKSFPLFDENGLIKGWTPWQRVMGAAEPVYGMGIDGITTNFWYLTKTINQGDTVKVTRWDITDTNLLGNLTNELIKEFPQANSGVHQLFNFNEQTPGFGTNFSMMVATGNQKVALIQTGKDDTGTFVPTKGDDFDTNLATYFKTYTDTALQNIGPICAADVSRSDAEDWLFVGGYNGLAVLRASNGDGWGPLNNLTTSLSGFTFKIIGSFKRVHKIVCDDTYLYVLTQKALYRIELDDAKFADSPAALNAEIIAQPTYANLTTCDSRDSFLDFVVSGKVGLLATTGGLYRTSNDKNVADSTIANARDWTEVKGATGYSLGPVVYISIQSRKKDLSDHGGNLYIISGNMTNQLATVIRYNLANTSAAAISDTTLQPITEGLYETTDPVRDYYYRFGEFRSAIVPTGTFCFNTLSKHLSQSGPARQAPQVSSQVSMRLNERTLPLRLDSTAHKTGIPVLNTASGAWIIPGDWGVNIHE